MTKPNKIDSTPDYFEVLHWALRAKLENPEDMDFIRLCMMGAGFTSLTSTILFICAICLNGLVAYPALGFFLVTVAIIAAACLFVAYKKEDYARQMANDTEYQKTKLLENTKVAANPKDEETDSIGRGLQKTLEERRDNLFGL
jgi:hypothetical protein